MVGVVGGGGTVAASAAPAAAAPVSDATAMRQGVIALAGAISAVGQTPQLASRLPLTTVSPADVLDLEGTLVEGVDAALSGTGDLRSALDRIDGVTVEPGSTAQRIAFSFEAEGERDLTLTHDDGDLRLGGGASAGRLTVSLRTTEPFVVTVDPTQDDALLRTALTSQPVMELVVDVRKPDVDPFGARKGFTELDVTGGTYAVHREQTITMRDPDGRSLLTLEDLRYSTLPDLFRIETDATVDRVDVDLDVALPDSLPSPGRTGAARAGTLTTEDDPADPDQAWPTTPVLQDAGAALTQATGLTVVDGISALAQYTGTVLALQDAADVPFPSVSGGTSDVFAPGDRLLEVLTAAAAAQVSCGVSPGSPPSGVAAPGDTVYCQAVTAPGTSPLNVDWELLDGGSLASEPAGAIGPEPTESVVVTGGDGEPDLQVSFDLEDQPMAGRTLPRTVQDVVRRLDGLADSAAAASLTAGRLEVAVDISDDSATARLPIGNPGTVGALVGLTGLDAEPPAAPGAPKPTPVRAEVEATDASFDVGFGISTGTPADGEPRETVLLPADASLLRIGGLGATPPTSVTDLPARVGFLGVEADLTELDLGAAPGGPAVELTRVGGSPTAALPLGDLVAEDGTVDADQLDLDSRVTGALGLQVTEQPLPGGGYAVSTTGTPASGTVSVRWGPAGLPTVVADAGYSALRVFDPVPAGFVSGTARVTGSGETTQVHLDVSGLGSGGLHRLLNVESSQAPVEVLRQVTGEGAACPSVVVEDADTLTCTGLVSDGTPVWADGEQVQAVVDGDPYAVRDAVVEGLAAALSRLDRQADDGLGGPGAPAADQLTTSLPLVDLVPAQLSTEREALRQGVAALDQAATEDEQLRGGGSLPAVSSAQEMSRAVGALVKVGNDARWSPVLDFGRGDQLQVSLGATTPGGTTVEAGLRLDDDTRGLVASGINAAGKQATFEVEVESSTTLGVEIDPATARSALGADTGTTSTATLDLGAAGLANHPLQAGVAALRVQADDAGTPATGSRARLGVRVTTTNADGTLETIRSSDPDLPAGERAASATLAVGSGDVIRYEADATETSGGAGTTQPAPDPMQVRFLAEGLDGLAAAIGSAQDGAAVRNLDPVERTPISAPLIGTDLDAGAEVPETLSTLTSNLRTQLRAIAPTVTEGEKLDDAIQTAVVTAVNQTDALVDVAAADVTAAVTCDGAACVPCPAPAAGTPAATCLTDTSTGWDQVRVDVTLTGTRRDGSVPFQTGLAGLEVRSDEPVTTTIPEWTLPVSLQLTRGVGPQVVVDAGDALTTTVEAEMPSAGIEAIVGYLPATIKPTSAAAGSVDTTIEITPTAGTYDLFQLYDGELTAAPSFVDTPGKDPEAGLELTFETLDLEGLLGLDGELGLPWTPADGFDTVTYDDVRLDVGKVLSTVATPFAVVDPYLAPVRDVVDVLRSPIPVISDLSELAGGGEVSLLTLLETASKATKKPQLELAHRVIGLIGGATDVISGVAGLAEGKVPLEAVSNAASLIEVEPSEVGLYEKCSQVTRTTTSSPTGSTTAVGKPQPCEDEDEAAGGGAAGQTAQETRQGSRNVKKSVNVSQKTKSVTGSLPGFSLPFLTDTDQIMNLLTGEGEASYFRLDLGTLAASVSYSRKFGPIMAGPVPIVPFVGGSISLEGRLAMGFDSYPQTLAAQGVNPGDVEALKTAYGQWDGGVITEGFYLDDLDADGEDVPEVKLVTTIEAGASVSIGIVSAGLKGGVTLTIGLDLNDPDDSGRLRTAEIRDRFSGDASCIFDASGDIEAFIAVFVEIELLFTSLEYEFDILRLGPYALFRYGCEDVTPALVTANGDGSRLTLTSGDQAGNRFNGARDLADEYEVRQFSRPGGVTRYEISAFGRVQNVDVTPSGGQWKVQVYSSATGASTDPVGGTLTSPTRPVFRADGGELDDTLSFLTGEDFTENARGELELETTPFDTDVTLLTGGPGEDVLTTGAGDDSGIDGEGEADTIDTGAGDDSATGGPGDDSVVGGSGRDDVRGGEGADDVSGGAGPDRVRGESGADRLAGGPGIDVRKLLVQTRTGGEADVERQAREGFDSGDVVIGGSDADLVDGGDGSDTVVGGEPTAALTGPMADLFVDGTRTVEVIIEGDTAGAAPTFVTRDLTLPTAWVPGEAQLDALCASGTELTGAAQTDVVTGGPEADVVVGGDGADVLDGGAGPDEVCGRAGDDAISGDGPGAELLGEDQTEPVEPVDGAENADVIRGGTGDDQVDAGLGDDVVFGDDVDLATAGGPRVLDGSLRGSGSTAAEGAGDDFLDGAEGDDVVAGGDGSDLLVGSDGDDRAYGEGRDTPASGGPAPPVSERLLSCNPTTRAVRGLVDLNGDLAVADTTTTEALDADTGQLAGLRVVEGRVRALGSSDFFSGLVAGEVVVKDGYLDLDRDGVVGGDADDTGPVPLASMIDDAGNADGDCVLAGDGDDDVRGGNGSDHLALGDGVDLADGGDGNDLVLGDGGTDVLLGGPHHDVLVGGLGADHLAGGDGEDRLRGNEGADDLVGGGETPGAADGQDVLLGGPSSDVLVAENGVAVSAEVVGAVAGATPSWAGDPVLPEAVEAGSGSRWRFQGSAMLCGVVPNGQPNAQPTRWVTLAREDGTPGTPVASPGTPRAYDELYGGADCDLVLGSQGDDLVRGGPDDDLVEGGPGADLGWGDDGDDVLLGGSSYDRTAQHTPFTTTRTGGAGAPDGADTLRGDGGPDAVDGDDLVAGDNALPTLLPARPTGQPAYELTLHDVAGTTSTPATSTSAGDTIGGDGGDDLLFGQGGGDVVGGGAGEDYLEGGSGADRLAGSDGDDDLVGGSSSQGRPQGSDGLRLTQALAAGPVDASSVGLLDADDEIDGGSGADWALGDNGRITRPAGQRHLARGAEATASGSGVFGGDDLVGGSGEDRLLGQQGEDDLDGDADEDHLEGNEGDDTLVGGSAADVVIGGSSLSPDGRGTLEGLGALARTQLDGGDVIEGDDASASSASPDLLLGDNATVLVVAGRPVVQLHDLATTLGAPAAGTSGDDEVLGGPASGSASGTGDRVFTQGGDDTVVTGPGEDYLEGGAGGDTLAAGGGDDDVLGGGSTVDGRPLGADGTRLVGSARLVLSLGVRLLDGTDTIEGDEGDDVLLGDNGVLTRPADAPAERADGTTLRTVRLLDPVTEEGQVPVTVGAGDTILAGEGRDLAFGQAGDDELQGQDGEDYLEGNVGADLLDGGADEDDLVGGGSVADGVVVSSSVGGTVTDRISTPLTGMLDRSAAGLLDGGDTVRGGDARDVVLGDNGRITREGIGRVLTGGASGAHRVRQVAMADEVPGPWAGSDAISGGAGDDDLYGQLDSTLSRRPQQLWQGTRVPGDVLDGGAGDDALVGDQGRSVPTPVALLGAPDRVVRSDGGFLAERVRPRGTLVRVVTLTQSARGGDDLLLAGDGLDAVHAGAGKDVVDAGAGDDAVFGGDGSDALWGGVGHDRVFGGAGADSLDTKRRRTDPVLWQLAAPRVDTDGLRRTLNGRDVLYGGSGTDALQADQGDRGGQRRVQGDRLVDWTARTSYFKVCSSGYGPGRVRDRVTSPMVAALRELARASGSVGSAELAIPVNERLTSYPGPRSLVCESR